jgi:hypothetical protein
MDRSQGFTAVGEVKGLRVLLYERYYVASLRYFESKNGFAQQCGEVLGHSLPDPLGITIRGPARAPLSIWAWTSPTEGLLLVENRGCLQRLDELKDAGCCINQTGGKRVVGLEGARTADLLARLSSAAIDAPANTARSGRLAEVPALIVSLASDLNLVAIDRVYLEHLLRFIEVTINDFK